MAVGAEVEIIDTPGYMPTRPSPKLRELLKANCIALVGEDQVNATEKHMTASSDMGDISSIMPVGSFGVGGIEGITARIEAALGA